MDITVVGRNAEIHPNFRSFADEKLAKVTLFYPRAQRVDVEVTHERNPRQSDNAERVELTVFGAGPVIRAEATSADRYSAFDIASGKLFERLRRARDRVKDHRHHPGAKRLLEPVGVPAPQQAEARPEADAQGATGLTSAKDLKPGEAREEQLGDTPIVVRQKVHEADPMSVDDALYQMELVGHPFFLFVDKDTRQPCVVYRRHGWTYGVIRLNSRVSA